MSTDLAKPDKQWVELQEWMLGHKKNLTTVLPSFIEPQRMMRVLFNSVRAVPKLLDCTRESLIGAMLEACYLGLEPGVQGQCWMIPYKSKATLVPGYRGLVQLALRSDQVTLVYAVAVYQSDDFEHIEFPPTLRHRSTLEGPNSPPDEELVLRGAYSIARLTSSRKEHVPYWVYMSAREVESIRKRSVSAQNVGSPWNSKDVFVRAEMWKKTAIRRQCKVLPMSVNYNRLADLDDKADTGEDQHLEDNVAAMEQGQRPEGVEVDRQDGV